MTEPEAEKVELIVAVLDDLVPDPENPRTQTDQGKTRLEKSLEHYGFVNPIIAYRIRPEDSAYAAKAGLNAPAGALFVVAGHQRVDAARAQKFEKVPVLVYPFRSLKEARAYNVADNKLQEMSAWDFPRLKDRLEDLDDGAFDVELTGFSEAEHKALVSWTYGEEGGHGRKDMDPKAVDEAGVKTTSKCPRCGFEW